MRSRIEVAGRVAAHLLFWAALAWIGLTFAPREPAGDATPRQEPFLREPTATRPRR